MFSTHDQVLAVNGSDDLLTDKKLESKTMAKNI
jgi:hypothetical protein